MRLFDFGSILSEGVLQMALSYGSSVSPGSVEISLAKARYVVIL